MAKITNVLSLFDGLSCGQIALKELSIQVDKYYASEIDKFAIEQTQLNFPNTIQLGDVTKWREWDIDWSSIDLVIGGSPCQGFSFAGKQLAFNDPRSVLFFEFVYIVNHVKKHNPDMKFLLENVQMAKQHIKVINDYMGVYPVEINSSLVSAQNRVRLYWSNIRVKDVGLFGEKHTDIPQPKDRNIYLKDILEKEVDDKYYLSDKMIKGLSNRPKGFNTFAPVPLDYKGKSRVLLATLYKMASNDNYINNNGIRRLTPTECARLQTIPDWYKWECSDTQQYKMLGNGWTIEVIKHIFKYL